MSLPYSPTEFDAAVERYRAAEREYNAASEALSVLVARRRDAIAARNGDIGLIQKTVADHFCIHASQMKSKLRPNSIAHPRQVAMALARELTKHSLQEIGEAFGGRDHGTVMHACAAVNSRCQVDATFRSEMAALRRRVQATLGLPSAA